MQESLRFYCFPDDFHFDSPRCFLAEKAARSQLSQSDLRFDSAKKPEFFPLLIEISV